MSCQTLRGAEFASKPRRCQKSICISGLAFMVPWQHKLGERKSTPIQLGNHENVIEKNRKILSSCLRLKLCRSREGSLLVRARARA